MAGDSGSGIARQQDVPITCPGEAQVQSHSQGEFLEAGESPPPSHPQPRLNIQNVFYRIYHKAVTESVCNSFPPQTRPLQGSFPEPKWGYPSAGEDIRFHRAGAEYEDNR
ncbi:hypothetical protein TNCT_633561 [Trichonephila clavata]|uniref:Uncharacterized protein n=1 Tax=Trichonephila clavata TaxID=2740835 RepID=A0A8X6H0N7_TRICU|nr:hypothetical protein TNCT_633561 [Trichonephila clavata]